MGAECVFWWKLEPPDLPTQCSPRGYGEILGQQTPCEPSGSLAVGAVLVKGRAGFQGREIDQAARTSCVSGRSSAHLDLDICIALIFCLSLVPETSKAPTIFLPPDLCWSQGGHLPGGGHLPRSRYTCPVSLASCTGLETGTTGLPCPRPRLACALPS